MVIDDTGTAAAPREGVVRSDAETSKTCSRTRRRGPRSLASRLRRAGKTVLRRDTLSDGLDAQPILSPKDSDLCQPRSTPSFEETMFTLFHTNIQGFTTNQVHLLTHLEFLNYPTFVALNETMLDESTEHLRLPGYVLVARRDRQDGRKGGGVALFVHKSFSSSVVLLEKSALDERCWFLLHTEQGPYLLGIWYRPPNSGEVQSIMRMEQEYRKYRDTVVGTILVGDLNTHHKNWLQFSSTITPEGRDLYDFCTALGFEEKVKKPTHENHLLDVVLTDLHDEVECVVQPRLTERNKHHPVLVTIKLGMPKVVEVERECWLWKKADWKGLNEELAKTNWDELLFLGDEPFEELPSEATARFTEYLLDTVRKFVSVKTCIHKKSTHSWLNERCRRLTEETRAADGTSGHAEKLKACSEGVFEEFLAYVEKTKQKLKKLPRLSKAW